MGFLGGRHSRVVGVRIRQHRADREQNCKRAGKSTSTTPPKPVVVAGATHPTTIGWSFRKRKGAHLSRW